MGLIQFNSVLTRQVPINNGVNQQHPLSRYVVEYTRIRADGIETIHGSKSNQLGSTPVAPFVLRSSIGRRAAQTSSTQYERAALRMATQPAAFTLYARVAVGTTAGDAGTAPASARYIYSVLADSGFGFGIGCPGSGLINAVSALTGNRINTTISVAPNQEYDVFLSHPGGNAGYTLEVLGVSSNTSSTSTTTPVSANWFVQVGANIATAAPGDKMVFFGGLFNKVLTADERSALAARPANIFKPSRILVPVSAAGGPPTLAAIAASNLTTSGARLTVT